MTPIPSPKPSRSPWQWFYGAAHRARYRWSRSRVRRLPRPVVSIGNLHWGGSGKTPLVAAIAKHLRRRGLFVAILSRGYGRDSSGVRIVSRGQGPLLGPRLGGDEPVLLAGMLPGVAVVVGGDRWTAGYHALERLDRTPDIFVLDDGFSHLALHRDLDLLAFPAADPFAGGRLLPSGRLREPLAASARADAVILTGTATSEGSVEDGLALANALRPFGYQGSGFCASRTLGPARVLGNDQLEAGDSVFVVSAIGRPETFVQAVRESGLGVAGELSFADHHAYPTRSLRRIEKAFWDSGARFVMATSKDRVKLEGRLEAPLAELPLRFELDTELVGWLDTELDELVSSSSS